MVFAACSQKPSKQEIGELQEAKMAAEAAEAKLTELRQQRIELEEELQAKKRLLEQKQQEAETAKEEYNR